MFVVPSFFGFQDAGGFIGLLDDYPGAAVAYSVRRLSGTYTGSLLQVRRSSNNNVLDIGFDSNGDLDTAALTSFCSGTDGFVTQWYDQSGNGRNASQGTALNQPKIVSSGSVINLNGKPTVQFNNNQILTRASFNLSQISIFTVINKYSMANYGGYFRNVTSSGVSFASTSSAPSSWVSQMVKFLNGNDQSPYVASSSVKSLPTNQYLENWIFNNSIQQLYENNINKATSGGSTGWGGNLSFSIGSIDYAGNSATCKNEIQDFIIYDLDQSLNRTGISTNINDYYGIY